MVIFNPNKLIIDSRLTPLLNGNRKMMDDYNMRCTSGHKWLFSITIGLLAFIIFNPILLYLLVLLSNKITNREKVSFMFFPGFIYSIILTIILILIIRLILW